MTTTPTRQHDNSLFGPLDDVAGDAGHVDHPPRVGFFTDTSVCIGCKACEVACKQWNGVPAGDDSTCSGCRTTTPASSGRTRGGTWPSSSSRPPLRRLEPGRPGHARMQCLVPRRGAETRRGLPLADVVGRVQALHARRLPGRLPDRGAVPHRVRHRGGAAGHLQRLRLLRLGLPVRGDRAPARATAGRRSARSATTGCTTAGAGLRQGLPDRLDPVRRARRAARAGCDAGGDAARAGVDQRPAVRARPGRRRRRQRRVLPAAGRARGLRPAAGPGRADPGHGADVGLRRRGRGGLPDRGGRGLRGPGYGGEQAREAGGDVRPRADDPNSYYGRPILKPPAWDWRIPAYLFAGGLSAGSTLLSTGADLSGRPVLRRRGRIAALAALAASTYFLVSDLGRRNGSTTCCGWPSRPRR